MPRRLAHAEADPTEVIASAKSGRQAPRSLPNGVSGRALVIACLLLVVLPVVGFYVEIAWLRGSLWGVPSAAPVLVLLALGGAQALRRRERNGLTRRELLTIYAIVLTTSSLVSQSMLVWMLPKVIHYYYFARAIPEWQTTFIPLLPTWFGPSDTRAVSSFFEGGANVPWSVWWVPLAAWCSFFLALIGASTSMVVLLQRQWIRNERLSFPLAQIPLTLIAAGRPREGDRVGRLTTARMFWLGTGISGGAAFLNSLARWVPAVPAVPLGPVPLMMWQKVGPLAGLGEIDLVLWPWLIALAFLIPADLSFSCWFFWFLRLGLTVLAITAGHTPQRPEDWWDSSFPAPYNQVGGTIAALAVWALWVGRVHLLRAARSALGREPGRTAADEPLPYRWSLVIFMVSTIWMLYLLEAAGCRLGFGFGLIAMVLAYYLVWAKLRAETGIGFLAMCFDFPAAVSMPFGSAVLRPMEVVSLYTVRWTYYTSFDQFSASTLESLKIADSAGISPRRLVLALAGSFLFSLAVGVYVTLVGCYHYGFANLADGGAQGITSDSWQPRGDGNGIVGMLTSPMPSDHAGLVGVAVGAAVTVLLAVMRLRLPWWPFHPAGYLAAMSWGMQFYYMPFLVGWAAKVLVLRYGGLRLYRRAVPLATGLIVGDMLDGGIWALVALATRGRL